MKHWAPLALLVGALCAGAQSISPGRVEGTVLSLTGEPIRKAAVRLEGASENGRTAANYIRTSDDRGSFAFENVLPGSYVLSAEKPGFVTQRFGAASDTAPGTQLRLDSGQTLKNLAIRLTPQGVVTGLITDLDGDPLAGARVNVLRSSYVRNRRQLTLVATNASNDLGEFRISNLAPGRYYLSATDTRAGSRTGTDRPIEAKIREANVTTYFPNALEPSSAAPVDVPPGAELRGLNIQIRRARVYSIRGRVIDASTGASAINTLLSIVSGQEGPASSVSLLRSVQQPRVPDGVFESHDLLPGTYFIQALPRAVPNMTSASMLTGRSEVTITDSDVDGAVLMLSPVGEVGGRVTLEGGDFKTLLQPSSQDLPPLAGSPGVGAITAVRPTIALLEADTAGLPLLSAQARDDGTFKIEGVAPSKYLLSITGLPERTYVKAIRFGLSDVTHAPLELPSASRGTTLDVVLSTKAADVSGIVRNSQNRVMQSVIVTLWSKNSDLGSPTGGVSTVYTGQNGGFRFSSVAPGDYYLAAWEKDVAPLIQNPDFRVHFQTRTSAVKLQEDTHLSIDPEMFRSDEIATEAAAIP